MVLRATKRAGIQAMVCPACGGGNIEALLRASVVLTRYSDHRVVGLKNGRLVLRKRPLRKWDDNDEQSDAELDEELKCMDCGEFPDIHEMGLGQSDFTVGEPKDG